MSEAVSMEVDDNEVRTIQEAIRQRRKRMDARSFLLDTLESAFPLDNKPPYPSQIFRQWMQTTIDASLENRLNEGNLMSTSFVGDYRLARDGKGNRVQGIRIEEISQGFIQLLSTDITRLLRLQQKLPETLSSSLIKFIGVIEDHEDPSVAIILKEVADSPFLEHLANRESPWTAKEVKVFMLPMLELIEMAHKSSLTFGGIWPWTLSYSKEKGIQFDPIHLDSYFTSDILCLVYPLADPFLLKGVYRHRRDLADLYSLGVWIRLLLEGELTSSKGEVIDPSAMDFISGLMSCKSSASEALAHPWLQDVASQQNGQEQMKPLEQAKNGVNRLHHQWRLMMRERSRCFANFERQKVQKMFWRKLNVACTPSLHSLVEPANYCKTLFAEKVAPGVQELVTLMCTEGIPERPLETLASILKRRK